ncbi:cysteine dioxygenase [Kitasatospora sp. NPDC089509]|uniref:cysteine dioxygenase family protein n=1 Tax=Kitasatospora sp. NPDC089509 TaxID=3364079 RepID=UPI00381E31CF
MVSAPVAGVAAVGDPRSAPGSRLAPLVEAIRAAVRETASAAERADAVAARLRPFLDHPDLLTPDQRRGDPENYRQHLLHVEPDGSFSVVSLVWHPGQSTSIHDHIAWCVTGVYEGEEHESRYRIARTDGDGELLALDEEIVNPRGQVSGIAPPGDIHRVSNSGDRTAISIHVYGADISRLGTSIQRVYRDPRPASAGIPRDI